MIMAQNVVRKSGEIDLIARKGDIFHFVEVKTVSCVDFPRANVENYGPALNLHVHKIRNVVRTSQWYLANIGWKGEWQVDGALVWLRERDGMARVRYLPQIA